MRIFPKNDINFFYSLLREIFFIGFLFICSILIYTIPSQAETKVTKFLVDIHDQLWLLDQDHKPLARLSPPLGPICEADFSPSGNKIALVPCNHPGTIYLTDDLLHVTAAITIGERSGTAAEGLEWLNETLLSYVGYLGPQGGLYTLLSLPQDDKIENTQIIMTAESSNCSPNADLSLLACTVQDLVSPLPEDNAEANSVVAQESITILNHGIEGLTYPPLDQQAGERFIIAGPSWDKEGNKIASIEATWKGYSLIILKRKSPLDPFEVERYELPEVPEENDPELSFSDLNVIDVKWPDHYWQITLDQPNPGQINLTTPPLTSKPEPDQIEVKLPNQQKYQATILNRFYSNPTNP
ncbi:MAG: hypothetical protein K1X44_07985 [Alphaproteobacteria bacterium]|nr:hypothetical protein [Alphaproteobacteria bacterium]